MGSEMQVRELAGFLRLPQCSPMISLAAFLSPSPSVSALAPSTRSAPARPPAPTPFGSSDDSTLIC